MSALAHAFLTVTEIDVGTALLFIALERLWPSLGGQRVWRRGMLIDIGYTYLAAVVAVVTAVTGVTAAFYSARSFGLDGGSLPSLALLPLAAQLAVAIVASDFFGYWKHRVLHTRWLWRIHAVHHSSEDVDWLSNERMHPVEMVLTSAFFVVPLAALGFTPRIIMWTAIARRMHSVYEHSNLGIDYGRGDLVFVSPVFHRWHHSSDAAAVDTNFANIFSGFDWLFGTYRQPQGAPPADGFGVPGFPRDLVGQLLTFKRGALFRRRPPPSQLESSPCASAP